MKTIIRLLIIAFVVLPVSFATLARAEETPPNLAGVKLVTASEAQKLQSSGAAILDVRVAAEYGESHITGAISVPYREKSAKNVNYDASQDEFAVAKLPADKKTPLVMYCNGPECWKSYKAAIAAQKAGYSEVHWFRGGFPEWKAAGLPVE